MVVFLMLFLRSVTGILVLLLEVLAVQLWNDPSVEHACNLFANCRRDAPDRICSIYVIVDLAPRSITNNIVRFLIISHASPHSRSSSSGACSHER